MTITELKAKAYDLLATAEAYQEQIMAIKEQLDEINKQIQELHKLAVSESNDGQ